MFADPSSRIGSNQGCAGEPVAPGLKATLIKYRETVGSLRKQLIPKTLKLQNLTYSALP